jgi:hypothetical protein
MTIPCERDRSEELRNEELRNEELRDANSCIAFGASLGAVGTGTALLAGATCPLCVVLAPALIGYGVWKRLSVNERSPADTASEADATGPARPLED